jgi:hypothetical protein
MEQRHGDDAISLRNTPRTTALLHCNGAEEYASGSDFHDAIVTPVTYEQGVYTIATHEARATRTVQQSVCPASGTRSADDDSAVRCVVYVHTVLFFVHRRGESAVDIYRDASGSPVTADDVHGNEWQETTHLMRVYCFVI